MKKYFYFIYVELFARNRFKRLNQFIVRIGLRGLGINNYENSKISGETNFITWLKRNSLLDVVFDIGANEGEYAKMCINNKSSKVYCFEPVKNTFERLKTRFKDNPTVEIFNFGFSDKAGNLTIYDKSNTGTQHATLYKEAIINSADIFEYEVELDTIDNFCVKNNINHISLLKIDTEGHEYSILKGAKEMLSNSKIDVIHFEFNVHNIYTGKFLKDFQFLLNDYNLYRLLPHDFLPIEFEKQEMIEFFFFQNIIAINKHLMILND